MKISILTLFPEMFSGPFDHSIVKRAIDNNLLEIEYVNIRKSGIGSHKTVDDTAYGGGVGMIMRVDVLKDAIDSAKLKGIAPDQEKIFLLSATGEVFKQQKAKYLSKLSHLILICGHYEGIDYRIREFIDGEISIGDFVLTGGEIPTMAVVDSVARLITGVLKEEATDIESFGDGILEHPQYTKPSDFLGNKVPEILLSGNHKEIDNWRRKEALSQTLKLRPDLLETKEKKH